MSTNSDMQQQRGLRMGVLVFACVGSPIPHGGWSDEQTVTGRWQPLPTVPRVTQDMIICISELLTQVTSQ